MFCKIRYIHENVYEKFKYTKNLRTIPQVFNMYMTCETIHIKSVVQRLLLCKFAFLMKQFVPCIAFFYEISNKIPSLV